MNEEVMKMSMELSQLAMKDSITDEEAQKIGHLYHQMMKKLIPQNLTQMFKGGEQK